MGESFLSGIKKNMVKKSKNKNSGCVYIVHHIDTEGPLTEPLTETFKRVEDNLHIKIKESRTEANLKKLQNGELVGSDPDLQARIKKFLDLKLLSLNNDWSTIDKMLQKIMSQKFRNSMRDSFGGGWIYNWHTVDHAGFETNERSKDLGYSKIFDHYEDIIKNTKSKEDQIHWHFHPISFFREAHISATSYENSYSEIHQILCRRLIDKKWFPRVNRAGFHSERPDSNWFLEQWIPFDPSNQSIKDDEKEKDRLTNRFADWTGAPLDWSLYHPDVSDWRKSGAMNRVIGRVLNMKARYRNISTKEIEKAFRKAQIGENVYLGITNHDFRDMAPEIENFRELLSEVAKKFPKIKYKFAESVDAFRQVLNYGDKEIKKNTLDFKVTLKAGVLKVQILKGEIFGPQPYLAIKTKKGEYFHDNFDFGKFKKEYFYTFDRYTIPIEKVREIGVAANDKYGNTCIVNL